MSEYADKHSKAHRKERVDHIIGDSNSKAKIDASGYTVPGELETEKKTGPCQPVPRKFAKGGKVEGHKAHHHAGRKSRDAGGPTAVEQLRPQVPSGGLYGSGFSPTHAGMLSTAGGLKKGGEAKKRASGGSANENSDYNTPETAKRAAQLRAQYAKGAAEWAKKSPEQQRLETRAHLDRVQKPSLIDTRGEWKDGGSVQRKNGTSRAEWRLAKEKAMPRPEGGPKGEAVGTSDVTGVRVTGGRKARAEGGRAKGKTNINIIIGGPKEQTPPMVPPPPSAMPPKPPLPPGAMGAMQPPGMGGGMPPGAPAGGMPPQMPPGMGPR